MFLFWVITGDQVCYPRVGCFTDDKPWAGIVQRPFKVLPWSPQDINTRFLLYTNESPNKYQVNNLVSVKSSNFNKNRKTRFVVHGFIDKGEEDWLTSVCKEGGSNPAFDASYL
uniref:Triacylglycerol lipase n=1 Tax=Vombatus ursinus TaxID=29139 RepID=A0A4X2KEN6_VOMUR